MTQTAKPKRKFHWWRVVLVISLAFNLLILGLAAGAILRFRDGPPPTRNLSDRDVGYGAFIAAFDRDDRRDLGRAYRQEMPSREDAYQRSRDQIVRVIQTLRAEPFSAEAFQHELIARRDQLEQIQERGQSLLVMQVERMSSEDRRHYADRLEEIINRPPRWHGHDDRDDHEARRDYGERD